MSLSRRGPNASQPARLPSLQAARAADPNVQRALEVIREWLEVRLGARGNSWERAVTMRDLDRELSLIASRIDALARSVGDTAGEPEGGGGGDLAAIEAELLALRQQLALLAAELATQVQRIESLLNGFGDFSTSVSVSVDGEVVIFDGTTGKVGKRATGTGFAKLASGVLSAQSNNAARATLGEKVFVLTDGATINVDAAEGNNFRVTLGGNRTLANPTNLIDGQVLNFRIKQDGTGSRTMAYGSKYKFPGGTVPVLSTAAGALDFMSCEYDATDDTLVCVMNKAFA